MMNLVFKTISYMVVTATLYAVFMPVVASHVLPSKVQQRPSPRLEIYHGSKLGTNEYNLEERLIGFAISDYQATRIRRERRLLCTTFLALDSSPIPMKNLEYLSTHCDWAFVFYNGKPEGIHSFCTSVSRKATVVHCARNHNTVEAAEKNRSMPMLGEDIDDAHVPVAIPKSVLYIDLLPYLPFYERVFLMDDDIALEGFNLETFLRVWNCGFSPPPLIVQPLIAESNQYINYLNLNSWNTSRAGRSKVVASAVGLVEQQVPLFDSIFFEWFVRRVLSLTKPTALYHGVDWGHDRSWCNAARMYAEQVLNYSAPAVACAVLVKGTSVHHLNKRSLSSKRQHRTLFHANGVAVVQRYIDLFPTWVATDVLAPNNPLDRRNFKRFPKITALNETCLLDQASMA